MQYIFTHEQLQNLLYGTIGMFLEYRDVHGRTEDQAQFCAVDEIFQGLEAEKELVEHLEIKPTLQTINTHGAEQADRPGEAGKSMPHVAATATGATS